MQVERQRWFKVFDTLRGAWKVVELRKKILFTILIIFLFRVGAAIPVPFLDATALAASVNSSSTLYGFLDVFTGGAFSSAAIFALSITPYINASIIIQLLTVAIPALERMAKDEGEEGKKKLGRITRYTTLGLSLMLGFFYYLLLRNQSQAVKYVFGFEGVFAAAVIIGCFVGGSMLIMWLGEQINDKGIGNGISILIFAGIVASGPRAIMTLISYLSLGNWVYYVLVPLVIVLFLAVIVFIVVMSEAERRIPVQYAKRVVGRKVYGGQATNMPIKVNMSGVLPIIFASSLLSVPGIILDLTNPAEGSFWNVFLGWFNYRGVLYAVLYFLLIIAFNYFYVGTQYNPVEMSNNIRTNSGTIPGIRPGKPTSDFIARIVSRITFIGALFLGVVAVLPIVFGMITGMNLALGGTSVIILVGVALETARQIESQMMMRHYKGFLE